jgi:hypothetical protein
MFKGWENFYLMVGPSAAALIGLMFVVVTLTAGRDRQEVERGKQLYTSPIVRNLAIILMLSGAAFAPDISPVLFASLSGGAGVIGVVMGVRSATGIARRPSAPDAAGFDMFWYGAAPAIAYVGMLAAALGICERRPWAPGAVAADLMALLLISIHAEWDLVTYLAPIAGTGNDPPKPD